MIIANSALGASLAIYLSSHIQRALMELLLNIVQGNLIRPL